MIPDLPLMRMILSSAPVEYFIIPAMIIRIAGQEPIRICHAYRDYMFEVDDQLVEFMGGQFTLTEPKRDSSGAQVLNFGFAGASARVSDLVRESLKTKSPVTVEILKFIEHENGTHKLGAVFRAMELLDSSIEGEVASFQAKFGGILDLAFPREVFNSINAPGTQFIS